MARKTGGAGKGAAARVRPSGGPAYEAKHLELLKAAASLFARHGYHDTSLRELSRKTGRSLSGLYYYFTGKEELLYQIQHHCYTGLLSNVREVLEDAGTPHEKVVYFISHHIAYFRRQMDEMKVLAHEDLSLTGEYGKRILELKRGYSQILIDIVADFATSVACWSSISSTWDHTGTSVMLKIDCVTRCALIELGCKSAAFPDLGCSRCPGNGCGHRWENLHIRSARVATALAACAASIRSRWQS